MVPQDFFRWVLIMAKEKPVDVYIFGAGASRAELQQMPLMNDFFAVLAKHASYGENDLWRCLTLLDCLRLFKNRHIECENLAAQIWLLRGQRRPSLLLAKKVAEYLNAFRKRMEDPLLSENLEEVFERAITAPVTYKQSPRHRILAAINRLFGILIDEKGATFPVFSDFVKKTLRKRGRRAVFISFNYDLILDRTLFALSGWSPEKGYGYRFKDLAPVVDSARRPLSPAGKKAGDILLLKPHGSLSWRYEINLGHDSARTYLSVDRTGAPAQGKYYAKDNEKYWKRFCILVVPPISAKSFSHPVLYETRRQVKHALQVAQTVTIIGWSLPETDIDMRNMIQRIFDDIDLRDEQLQKLRVVDFQREKKHFFRLQSLFMAKENSVYNKGFGHFVSNVLK
jgi:hypothetical protein